MLGLAAAIADTVPSQRRPSYMFAYRVFGKDNLANEDLVLC
jgi:hypothetical protein